MDSKPKKSTNTFTPLKGLLPKFAQWLKERGYAESTVIGYQTICSRFDHFLAHRGIQIVCLTDDDITSYVEQVPPRRPNGRKDALALYYRAACRRLLEYLRSANIVPTPTYQPSEPVILLNYLNFLRKHRGVVEQTIKDHHRHVSRFLVHAGMEGQIEELRTLSVEQVDRFFVETTKQLKRTSLSHICSAIRGFLKYLHMTEVLPRDLSTQVMTPRLYSLETLPRGIDWEQVERTLATVDRESIQGRRDYAVLTLLAYDGLRAGEVAALCLKDIDWRHDKITVRRSKRDTVDTVPLVPVVGEALVDYLRYRPASPYPQIFLKVIAPCGPLSPPCISYLARKHLLAAEVKATRLGSHTLRHAQAIRLLRMSFPLKTIGDILGHQSPQSTFIYTKAAVEDLRTVALGITEVLP